MIIKQEYFQLVTEGVKPVNDGKNRIYYGELHEFFNAEAFRNFSIKLTLQGSIYYKTQQREYRLEPNNFLLAPKQPGSVIISSPTLVKGVFIDIQQETIREAFDVIASGHSCDFDGLKADYFFSRDFFENTYAIKNGKLGMALSSLVRSIFDGSVILSDEIFLALAEKVVVHELDNCKSLTSLKAVRSSTKKELLRRLLQGKDFIDDNFLKNPGIAEIVRHCNMSAFHFFRSFKQAFGCSPYQYIINKRLEYAKLLIRADHSFTATASQCGFADLFTFSKAFKKLYGISPSEYKTRKLRVAIAG